MIKIILMFTAQSDPAHVKLLIYNNMTGLRLSLLVIKGKLVLIHYVHAAVEKQSYSVTNSRQVLIQI